MNLFKVVTQLDDRRSVEHSGLVEDELSVFEGVDVALD
jgi:hypothetical protein